LARKFKLSPNFFSKIYHSIDVSSELKDLPSQKDLKFFEERSKEANESEEILFSNSFKRNANFSFDNSDEKESQNEPSLLSHTKNKASFIVIKFI